MSKRTIIDHIPFNLGLQNIPLPLFIEAINKNSFTRYKLTYFELLDFFKFVKLILCMIAFDNALVKKGLLFPRMHFFSLGAWRLSNF